LGEVHDLDVLWATALRVNAFPTIESRSLWHVRITEERSRRIDKYRARMLGENSLWQVWRAALPGEGEVRKIALSRLKLWASALDPDFKHSNHVAKLALQLYDVLPSGAQTSDVWNGCDPREILQVAALLHGVSPSKRGKKPHNAAYKLINRLTPPLGWGSEELHLAAVVARYHRGALPNVGQTSWSGVTPGQRQRVSRLAGILRLAHAFDAKHDGRIQRVRVEERTAFLVIVAEGYSPRDRMAEVIAAARHLLEIVYRRPVMVKPEPRKRIRVRT
ncbi:MAG: hypothetical protein ACRD2S_08990, partial [Terriglobales bacterium]